MMFCTLFVILFLLPQHFENWVCFHVQVEEEKKDPVIVGLFGAACPNQWSQLFQVGPPE
jgi:hypothetical protein